jgi:hypothetical protein
LLQTGRVSWRLCQDEASVRLPKSLEIDQLIVVTWSYNPLHAIAPCYELLAEAFALKKTENPFGGSMIVEPKISLAYKLKED